MPVHDASLRSKKRLSLVLAPNPALFRCLAHEALGATISLRDQRRVVPNLVFGAARNVPPLPIKRY